MKNKDLDLYGWVQQQRKDFHAGKLSQDKIDKLNGIGFCWTEEEAKKAMKKQVVIFLADQSSVMIYDANYKEICDVDEDFKSSAALQDFFGQDIIKSVFIMLYRDAKGEDRRRIAGSKELDHENVKQVITMMAESVDIQFDFYDFENAKKILQMDKVQRENLKLLIENSQKWIDP